MTRPYITYPYKVTGGVTARTSPDRFTYVLDIRDFGAESGVDCSPAIALADAAAVARGGGIVYYPPGTWLIDYRADSLTQRCAVIGSSRVYHRGAGRGATIVKLADGANAHMFLWRDQTDYGLTDMTLDGNRANQATPPSGNDSQGTYSVGTAVRAIFERLHIHDTFDYGIGVQVVTAIDCRIDDVVIEDAGADAIDFKNTGANSTGNVVTRLTARRFGLQGVGAGDTFCGLNTRGQCSCSDIRIEDFGGNWAGIRANAALATEETAESSMGGFQETFTNITIVGNPATRTGSIGFHSQARRIIASNVIITGVNTGLQVAQGRCSFSNFVINDCLNDGVKLNNAETAGGAPLFSGPDANTFTNFSMSSCGNRGVENVGGNRNTFANMTVLGDTAISGYETSGADNTFIGGDLSDVVPNKILNTGTGNRFIEIRGMYGDFVNDAAAAAGGVPVGGTYRNGSVRMIRVA